MNVKILHPGVRISLLLVCIAWSAPALAGDLPIAPGKFEPTLDSLTNYNCPDWFRDAKFGIWSHWGPQAVPMAGDWYARHMYVQGHRQYLHHLQNYGHPSTNGYKEIIQLWKAEKWDPDRLMALYKKAGAKYFVSMGSHHDNFYLWDSQLHPWTAVKMGPRRDVVGDWQRAARRQGLRFGVSEHLGASFTWFQDSHKSDSAGPLAGVPYDGADPKFQDLYHFPAEPGDTGWYSNNPRWQRMWFDRIRELVDNYKPDLLYTDGGVPFGNEVGRSLIAHYYNADGGRRGRPQVVYTCKQKSQGRWIEDLERGVMPGINPYPWQTDTSIGDWYYNKDWKFRPVSWTIHMLVDIVSKNGNLLLNVVQRPDGSLDPEVEDALAQLADWIAVHGEAIYGTRPWLTYGEGAVRARGGHFGEDFAYTSQDIRFTTKGKTLYAVALGWPADGKLLVRSLAEAPGEDMGTISKITLLGHKGKIQWTRTTNGLEIALPAKTASSYTCALKIQGRGLKPAPLPEIVTLVKPESDGSVVLRPDTASLHGDLKTEAQGGQPNIGFWDNAADWVSWRVAGIQPGRFKATAHVATLHEGARFAAELGGRTLTAAAPRTSSWAEFKPVELGEVQIGEAKSVEVKVRSVDAASWKAINLRSLTLTPVR